MSNENLGEPQEPVADPDEQPIEIEHETEAAPEPPPPPSPPLKPPSSAQQQMPPPMPPTVTSGQPGDPGRLPGEVEQDDAQYGAEVQKRIQQLRYLGHSERRAKDAAMRERDQYVARVNELHEENTRLRAHLTTSEDIAIGQALAKVAARIESAKAAYAQAHAAGDVDGLVKAQEQLATAIAERDRVSVYQRKPAADHQSPAQAAAPASSNVAPAAQELDLGTQAWLQRNQWFFNPAYKTMRDYAMTVHNDLKEQGIMPMTPREYEYFATVDQRLREKYPEQFGPGSAASAPVQAQNANATTNANNGRTEARTPPRPVTPSAGTRTSGKAPVKVKLNPHQVQLCQKLGIKEEDYARELIKETQR